MPLPDFVVLLIYWREKVINGQATASTGFNWHEAETPSFKYV